MPEKKDVWITITGTQTVDGESDETELITQGRYYQKDDRYFVLYDESETTGFDGCKTMLTVESDRVTMTRNGAYKTNLLIEQDKHNVGYYGTSEGQFVVGVRTKSICSQLTDAGGTIEFSYALDINAVHISDNRVVVDIKPQA